MAKRKEKLIDKFVKKDYNNDLEEVLTKKNFNEEVKNLLLDILYKIENSYKDYENVKKNVVSEEEYIQNIIKSVKENCETINFIAPDESQKQTFKVNKEQKEIECYPIARKLLYCISKIQKSNDIIKNEPQILNKALTNMINVGNNINTVEPLRDFNGFSWNIAVLDIENFYYNIVYQDLVILCGNRVLEEWTNEHDDMIDYLDLLKEELEKKYGKKFLTEITNLLKHISILLEFSTNKEFMQEITEQKENIENELEQMEDKVKYLNDLSKKKKQISDKIKSLDIIINDNEKLSKEYSSRNKQLPLEQKIFSKRILKIKLEEEKDGLFDELKQCNVKMNSRNFLQRQKQLKNELEYLNLANVKDLEKEILNNIILLQKRTLQAIKLRISKVKTKEQLIKIFYEIRYFNLIPISTTMNLGEVPRLKKMLNTVEKDAIEKAYELKFVNDMYSKNLEFNTNIIKNIFLSDVIRLEDIYVKFIEKEEIYIQFYDENIVDKKIKLDYDWKKEGIKLKLNKKMKIFI